MKTELLVVGGGPAGLMAAIEAAENDVVVTIVEESHHLGGQLRQQTQFLDTLPEGLPRMRGVQLAKELVQKVTNNENIHVYTNHAVIGIYEDGRVGLNNGREILSCQADKVVVATGADIQAVFFSGWTLPGVMTIGASQIMVNRERIKPGNASLMVGSSDFSLEVALQLQEVGIEILGIVEKETKFQYRNEDLANLVRAKGIPLLNNSFVEQAKGNGQVEKVLLNQDGKIEEYEVDLVCVDGGLNPIVELCQLYDCSFTFNEKLGGWIPSYQPNFQSSADDVFVAGNAAGITCQGAVLITGKLAGLSVAESLGKVSPQEADLIRSHYWSALSKVEQTFDPLVHEARIQHVRTENQVQVKVYES
ncbi:NAD(P)/FAD-dependent oxidoreductase [Mesobacillus maritimus]|uniref:NAD(P)/FAD-dependent oxidoreductase n=1 Tax=Mesobacillus maritimus TaxID=1643336 RepID=UPI00384F811C